MCCVMVERQAYMAYAESATPAGVMLRKHAERRLLGEALAGGNVPHDVKPR